MNRRQFFNESVWLAAGAGMVSSVGPGLSAQTRGAPVRQPDRYSDSLILERKAFKWPAGKALAIWIIPNVEVWDFHSAAGAAISPQAGNVVPDNQLRLARIRHARGFVADRGRIGFPRNASDRGSEFRGVSGLSAGHRANEEAQVGVHGTRNHE